MKKLLMLAAIVVVASTCVVIAQEQQPTLKPSVSPKSDPVPTKLLLEIAYNRELPPAYAAVNGVEEKPKWMSLSRFTRILGREIPSPRIQAVKLESVYNGETADVRVTLLRGAKGVDQEDLIGVYHLGIGEQRTVSELDQFGIKPFTITLLNTVPPLPPPPSFENLTKSLEVVSVQSENMPMPAYRVVFRNLSDKSVSALHVQMISDGRAGVSSFWQGEHGEALIKPGAAVERWIPVTKTVKTVTGYAPGAPQANTVSIRSVVFEDLSFEGNLQPACSFERLKMARRLWLKHLVPLLDQELAKSNPDHIEAAKQFKEKFSALTYVLEPSERDKASSVAPTCAKPGQSAAMAAETMKLELLRELDQIITTRPSPAVNFKAWLQQKRSLFSGWLSRL